MQNIAEIFQPGLSLLLIIAIALPLVKNSYWIFRVLEYPRFQLWSITLLLLLSWLPTFRHASITGKIVALLLFAGFVFLTRKIWPYTFLAGRQMKSVNNPAPEAGLKIFTANVLQDNKKYEKLISQILATDPDLVLLVETDEDWKANVDRLRDRYPFYLGCPLSNTYGMLLYSKLEIEEGLVRFLTEPDIPSIRATVLMRSGKRVRIYAVHPKPPVPGEAKDSDAKDKEIMKVAFEAADSDLPVIVMGDFNDVAWSRVTRLFQKTAGLLDPRRGRGFYTTFSAHSFFIRFPLDYIFCSADFGLVSMRRLPKNGSDHFAIFTELQYDASLPSVQGIEAPDSSEEKEAENKASATVRS